MKKIFFWTISIIMVVLLSTLTIISVGCKAETVEETEEVVEETVEEAKEAVDAGTFMLEGVEYNYADYPKSDIVIAKINTLSQNAWRLMMIAAWIRTCDELKSVGLIGDYLTYNVDGDEAGIAAWNDCINKGVDVICSQFGDSTYGTVISKALDADIKLIAASSYGMDDLVGPNFIIINNDEDTYMRGPVEYLCEQMDYKGEAIYLYGDEGIWAGSPVRQNAVYGTLEKYNIPVIHKAACMWSNTEGYNAMTTLLAAYGDDLSGDKDIMVINEDVGLGVIQAYDAAGIKKPPILGDYTYGFLRAWAADKDLLSVGNCCAADYTYTFSYAAYLMCNGFEVDPEKAIGQNGLPYYVVTPMPFIVIRGDYNKDAEWVKNLPEYTDILDLDEVVSKADKEGLSDNQGLERHLNFQQTVDSFFKKS